MTVGVFRQPVLCLVTCLLFLVSCASVSPPKTQTPAPSTTKFGVQQFGVAPNSELRDSELITRYRVSSGVESLHYKEKDPDSKTDSEAEVLNAVLGLEIAQQAGHRVLSLSAIIPSIIREDDEEITDYLGIPSYRINTLKYKWTRIDTRVGYSLKEAPDPYPVTLYTGLRWQETKHQRSNFVELGTPQPGKSTERTRSLGLLLGLEIEENLAPQPSGWDFVETRGVKPSNWTVYWGIEGNIPLIVKNTNSGIPGVTFRDRGGFTIQAHAGISYQLSVISYQLSVYAGRMRWEGSDWEKAPSGEAVKWPENDTKYLGGTLSLVWRF